SPVGLTSTSRDALWASHSIWTPPSARGITATSKVSEGAATNANQDCTRSNSFLAAEIAAVAMGSPPYESQLDSRCVKPVSSARCRAKGLLCTNSDCVRPTTPRYGSYECSATVNILGTSNAQRYAFVLPIAPGTIDTMAAAIIRS